MPPNKSTIPPQVSEASLERERLYSLINSMTDGVITTDEHGMVISYNAAALNLLDRNTSIEGISLGDILPLKDKADKSVNTLDLLASAKVPLTSRDYLLHYASDDSTINLYIGIAPVRLGFGKTGHGGYVITLRDITKEKSLEEERDEFISVTSHELRTPMAIAEGNISNAQYVLNKTSDTKMISQALEETHKQILYLTGLINDLSTLSRAERGKLDVDPEPINGHEVIQELANSYKSQIEAKGLSLALDIDPNLSSIKSSRLYVKEILQNFMTNAIKYTPSGTITIHAHSKPNGIEFGVTDSGIGISKSDQARLFEKFFRSEDYRTRQSSGTGLGLYVTAKLAKLINATITLDSKLNEGSTFKVFIPNIEKQAKA